LKKELSVIIPAYNEEAHILETLREVGNYFSVNGYRYEVLVVNDGSTDATRQMISQAASEFREIRLIDMPHNSGKGEAVKAGVRQAQYAHCLFLDADNSTRVREWDKFEKAFDAGARVAVASRRVQGSRIVYPQPFMRRFLGGGYRVLGRTLFGLDVRDFNCGFKAYETAVAKRVYEKVKMKDWTFDLEVFCLLKKEGISVAEIPVTWEHKDKKSGLKPVGTALKSLQSVIEIRKRLG
jgi:dolichyl-phosphate beta-glucosyltransferase